MASGNGKEERGKGKGKGKGKVIDNRNGTKNSERRQFAMDCYQLDVHVSCM